MGGGDKKKYQLILFGVNGWGVLHGYLPAIGSIRGRSSGGSTVARLERWRKS